MHKTLGNPNSHLLVLKKGDDLVGEILSFCAKNGIRSASFSGIGALSEVSLALYDLDRKEYMRKSLTGPLELLSMSGNIGIHDAQIMAHVHVVVSDSEMAAFGGHLEAGTVAATCEVILNAYAETFERIFDDEIGLKLIKS